MKCPVVSLRVSMDLVLLFAAYLLMFRVMFLFWWRISMACLALELSGSFVWFQCRYEDFGWALFY